MKKSSLAVYFSQRFPIAGVLFIATVTALSSAGLYRDFPTQTALVTTLFVSVSFAAFLLRQRVVDEFKDKLHDAKNFPDRPFQKGVIDAQTLITMGVVAFGLEILTVYFAGGKMALVWYMPVLFYSLLMMKEFFCGKWLAKHFTLYFIAHEIIFIFYGVWLIHLFNAPFDIKSLAWIIYFVALLMSIEVGRKFTIRKDPKGRIVKDTYTAVWGREQAITVLGVFIMTSGVALSIAESTHVFALFSAISVFAMYACKRRDALVKATIIIHGLLLVMSGVVL